MREISIDLSYRQSNPTVFAGYEGEHNATQVTIVLPIEMANSKEITTFYPRFCTSCREDYVGETIVNTGNQKIIFKVHQAITRRGKTEIQIEGKDSEGNIIARSALGYLVFNPSVNNQGKELGLVVNNDSLIKIQEEIQESVENAQESAMMALNAAEEAKKVVDSVVVPDLSNYYTKNEVYTKEDIDKMLNAEVSVYKSDAPDWVSHDESSVDPYSSGKDVYFKADIKAGEKYVVRFSMEHQEGYDDSIVLLSTKNSGDSNDRIDSYKFADYNQDLGCYEAEFVARRDTLENEELMLYVGYPRTSFGDLDLSAVFGKAEIYYKGNLQSIVDNQNIKIAAIYEDVETALDGIITLQENLIGGGSV